MKMQKLFSTKEQNMNIEKDELLRQSKIRDFNDQLRIHGRGGRILMTAGLHDFGDEKRQKVIEAVRAYDAFSPDNDPYGEHDFGEVEVNNNSVMFKIDYYDLSGSHHSPDAADPAVTLRVMTLMLSDEY
jgi:hypothetical protein